MNRLAACGLAFALGMLPCWPQVIEFESHGLKYQTLTKSAVTVMYASLPARLREYAIVQAAVSNGSAGPYIIRPEDFTFIRSDGSAIRATSANAVVQMISQHGSRSDVLKLVTDYETALYGVATKSTHGYEERKEAALLFGPAKFRAAATASAVALVQTKLAAGESTDGAVFFATSGKPLGPGHLLVRTTTDTFEFKAD
jgi:hypothetical protein